MLSLLRLFYLRLTPLIFLMLMAGCSEDSVGDGSLSLEPIEPGDEFSSDVYPSGDVGSSLDAFTSDDGSGSEIGGDAAVPPSDSEETEGGDDGEAFDDATESDGVEEEDTSNLDEDTGISESEDCTNGVDDNGNGLVDCEDTDCDEATDCPEDACDDLNDDDGDGLIDCEDPDCADNGACKESSCEDGIDNDKDDTTDCDDVDCAAASPCIDEDCFNAVDDDNDGLSDCDDPECIDILECAPEDCSNHLDDDEDGLVDCLDPECAGNADCGESNCEDGNDEDGDGFTDCADSECINNESCVEDDCINGIDDDNDGLSDCADPDCSIAVECVPESCVDYYLCLGVDGCGCTLGVNCPPVDSAEFGACQGACYSDNSCNQGCFSVLSPVFQGNLVNFMSCTDDFCLEVPDEETTGCVFDNCLTEYSKCFYVGPQSCSYYSLECEPACAGDLDCEYDCLDALSSNGFEDAYLWDECRYILCDQDGDFEEDSPNCLNLAGYAACVDTAGTCLPVDSGLGEGTCGESRDCFLSCHPFLDEACMSTCVSQAPTSVTPLVSDLFTCIINTCGTTALDLNMGCIQDALSGACNEENTLCGP
jgi:hypothetical protein